MSTSKVSATTEVMNPDISRERRGSQCIPRDLTILLLGGLQKYQRKKLVESVISAEPLFDESDRDYRTDPERYDIAVRRAIKWQRMREENNLNQDDDILWLQSVFTNDMAFAIHGAMFVPTIRRLANEEQLLKWLPLAENCQIIGAYAQTELGHGSFLNGLETTATFDRDRQEFVLNTPSLSSMKWWPGGLGVTVNHTVIIAQLIINGQRCGTQAFLLQIRDMRTHKPMPGCEQGDIGPKWGGNGSNNGYLRLHHVRIPRENMLMKYMEVTPDGQLVSRGNPKLLYGSMILMRTNIVMGTATNLAKAITIAIRYSSVRKQGLIEASDGEVPVLDYQSQQDLLFPLLASTYCFFFVYQELRMIYDKSELLIQKGEFSQLPELHSLSCALKAYCSDYMIGGVSDCLYACGGHGYLMSSGLPWMYNRFAALPAVEGTTQLMLQQTARALIKSLNSPPGNKRSTTDYLHAEVSSSWCVPYRDHVRKPARLVEAFQHRAQRLVTEAANNLKRLEQGGLSRARAWNQNQVNLIAAAKAHAELYCVEIFCGRVSSHIFIAQAKAVASIDALRRLCYLHALSLIRSNSGEFLLDGFISRQQMSWVNEEYFSLLSEIRPDAVVLVDAFDFSDATLHSTLGCYDGRAYERLYESTKHVPWNQKPVHDVFHKYLQPFLGRQSRL